MQHPFESARVLFWFNIYKDLCFYIKMYVFDAEQLGYIFLESLHVFWNNILCMRSIFIKFVLISLDKLSFSHIVTMWISLYDGLA